MAQFTLLVASAAIAVFGWGWVKQRIMPRPMDRVRMEQQLQKEGVLKSDGTIAADKEFDVELNALARELNALDADAAAELDATASVQ
ncbi:MAG: hypothetical protein IT406_03705 [Candidatus Yanofskybacteria bacterium]|nr:hypothetical protein [Candidatus Yanofskybacteria bacterium]